MNNKGFIFIETIITVVVVMATLLLLYSSFSKVIINEQSRLYHDDIAYVYKTKHIADILKLSIDYVKFEEKTSEILDAPDTDSNGKYIYIFNIESDIYSDNSLITAAHELYDFYRLVYIRIKDIPTLKKCLNGDINNAKCSETKKFITAHGYNQLTEYLKTLDVATDDAAGTEYSGHAGILVSLMYEAKNGDVINDANSVVSVGKGKYSECVYREVNDYYAGTGMSETNMFAAYDADDNLNFDMACQNAYYISWVYL